MYKLSTLHYIQILLFALMLSGCAGFRNNTASNSETKPVWSYGNYCGGGYPRDFNTASKTHRPIDDIDLTCKLHDECYDIGPEARSKCDAYLRANLHILFDGERISNKCAQVAWEMRQFVEKNPSTGALGLKAAYGAIDYIFWPVFLGLTLSSWLDEDRPCNSSKRFITLIAPKSHGDLARARECEAAYIERRVKAAERKRAGDSSWMEEVDRQIVYERRGMIGPGRTFLSKEDVVNRRGCADYPVIPR